MCCLGFQSKVSNGGRAEDDVEGQVGQQEEKGRSERSHPGRLSHVEACRRQRQGLCEFADPLVG